MSELAEDLVVEGSEDTPSESEVTPLVGADLLPESAEPSPENDETSEASGRSEPDFDIDKVDLLSIDTERLPDEYQPLQKYARRFQSEMDRSRNQLDQERRESQEARKEYLEAIQKLAAPKQETPSTADPFESLDLTPQERAGLSALEEKYMGHVKPIEAKMVTLDSKIQEVDQILQRLNGYMQTQQNSGIEKEIQDVKVKYPDAIIQDERVVSLYGRMNPDTGEKISLMEAYELVTGRKAEEAVGLRVKDQLLRNGAKRSASSRSAIPADGTAPLSEAEGLSHLANLGFER